MRFTPKLHTQETKQLHAEKHNQDHTGVGGASPAGARSILPVYGHCWLVTFFYWFISLFIGLLTIVGADPLNVRRGQVVVNEACLRSSFWRRACSYFAFRLAAPSRTSRRCAGPSSSRTTPAWLIASRQVFRLKPDGFPLPFLPRPPGLFHRPFLRFSCPRMSAVEAALLPIKVTAILGDWNENSGTGNGQSFFGD